MPKKPKEHGWTSMAAKNAKTRAKLHIEAGDPRKIAETLSLVDPLSALEFLFHEAERLRSASRHKKAAIVLEAATLIRAEIKP